MSIYLLITAGFVINIIICRRVCGTRIRVEMSSGRTRRDEGPGSGGGRGGGGRPRREEGGRRGGERRHRFEHSPLIYCC